MSEKEAFIAGFRAARRRGNPNAELHPVSESAAESIFEKWKKLHDE